MAMETARGLLDRGQPEAAVEVLTEALESCRPGNTERAQLLLARSEAHLESKCSAAARRDAEEALQQDASLGRAWLLKAAALRTEGDSLRADAHAACALQLAPGLKDDVLYQPWTQQPMEWVFVEAAEQDARGTDFTRLDRAFCDSQAPAVFVLGPGTHYGSTLILTRRAALIGLGRPGEVQLVNKRRLAASDDTLYCDAPPAVPILLENLSIACDLNHALLVASGKVAAHRCTFASTGTGTKPAVSAVGGRLSLEGCSVDGCRGAGGVMAAHAGAVTLRHCTVRNCKLNGMEACYGGSLQAEDCSSYNNMQGALVRDSAGAVRLSQCTFYNNLREGVMVWNSKRSELVLRSCQAYQNGTFGVTLDAGSRGVLRDCRIHGNGFWGVIIKSVSDAELQGCEVFGNKCGGVYLGLNSAGVVKLAGNHIHHNLGQGFRDIARDDQLAGPVQRNRQMVAAARAMGLQTTSRAPQLSDNRMEENEERHGHPAKLPDWEKRCSMCQVAQVQSSVQKLQVCSNCRLERYCSADCQRAHWPRHRPMCKLATAGHEVLVDLHPLSAGGSSGAAGARVVPVPHPLVKVKKGAKTPEEKGGNIIVKIQTVENEINPNQWLTVYDASRTLSAQLKSPALFNLIMDQGVLGANGFTSKKVYAYARVEQGGSKLRVLTHQLAPVPGW